MTHCPVDTISVSLDSFLDFWHKIQQVHLALALFLETKIAQSVLIATEMIDVVSKEDACFLRVILLLIA